MHGERRVVITGLGAVTPIGIGVDSFWQGLLEGRNGVDRVSHFDATDFRSKMSAEVKDFDATQWVDKKTVGRFDRYSFFALAASQMAFDDAGLVAGAFNPALSGVIIGSGIGGADTIQQGMKKLVDRGPSAVSPFFIPAVMINMAASLVSIRLGFKGPLAAPSVACSTGGNAIGEAFRMIQRADVELMLAGSGEAAISPLPYAGFCSLRAMSQRNDDVQHACRPFDKDRDGFVMGEGSGMVVLEELEHARARGARIYAELIGYGNTADAFHYTAPHPDAEGMVRVMRAALQDAGIRPEEIDHINSHGTSTQLNDKAESLAILQVFPDTYESLPVTSIKSMIGHLLGGAGSVEFIATVKSLQEDMIPPTINTSEVAPDCSINLVTGKAKKHIIRTASTNNFGFGGGNASLIVRKI